VFYESLFNAGEPIRIACWWFSAVRDCALSGTVVKYTTGGVRTSLLLEPL
jgi:hypothetical protein